MLAFFRRLGLLGQDGTGRGEGLVVVVRVVQIHELKSQQKNNCRVEKWTTKGEFFLTPVRNL
jgi:hypothetical protein